MSMHADRVSAELVSLPRSGWSVWPAAGEVHVWEADLAAGDWQSRDAALSSSEIKRAGDLRFERDARRFVRSRIFRRSVLGAYLRLAPEAIGYREDDFGRPAILPHLLGERSLDFSASKSGERALLAVGASPGIGVDVEMERTLPDLDQIARDFFNASEVRAIERQDEARARCDAFYRCWTRKEALVKALGIGLQAPLDQFVVGTTPKEAAFRPSFEPGWNGPVGFWMTDLSDRPAFAALATSTPLTSLSLRRWTV